MQGLKVLEDEDNIEDGDIFILSPYKTVKTKTEKI